MEQRTIRVGLVGAGQISEFHIRALRRLPFVDVVGIADTDERRASAVASRHRIPATVSSIDALIDRGVDVIHVLTPPAAHAALALRAMERGCHVYVEKPLATTAEDCDVLAQASRVSGRHVGVGHSLLNDPFIRRGDELLQGGSIGTLVSVDHYRSQAPPPYGGGPLPDYYADGGFPFRDLGVHALYVIEYFLGPLIEAVPQIRSSGDDPNLVCDEWQVMLRADRGVAGIHLSWRGRPQQNVYVLNGTRGTIRIDLVAMTVTMRRARRVPEHANRILNTLGESGQAIRQSVANAFRVVTGRVRQYHGLQDAVMMFYERLQAGQEPAVGPTAARSTVYWTEEIARYGDEYKRRIVADRQPMRHVAATTLVTGATGFVGRHLVAALRESGEPLRLFVRSSAPPDWRTDAGIEIMVGDLGDPAAVDQAMQGMTRVFHLGAAMGGSGHDFERSTVQGTRNVVDSAIRHQVQDIVYMSSLAVLHNAAVDSDSVITESWPLEPRSSERGHYTRTKLQAEAYVREAMTSSGLKAVILRPAEIVDARRPLLTASIAQRIGQSLLVFGDGAISVPIVDIHDVVAALRAAGDGRGVNGQVFHLVAGSSPTQNELIYRYIDITGERLRIVRIPKGILYAGARAAEWLGRATGRDSPLSVYRLDSALVSRRFDCSAAERGLGWKASATQPLTKVSENLTPSTVGAS